jgi:hypothetical protein
VDRVSAEELMLDSRIISSLGSKVSAANPGMLVWRDVGVVVDVEDPAVGSVARGWVPPAVDMRARTGGRPDVVHVDWRRGW